jgi:SAM-dependent methyltransferase
MTRLEAPDQARVYVCPECKGPLAGHSCERCHTEYARIDGIPVFLPNEAKLRAAAEIARAYDAIYRQQPNVWATEGRTPAFFDYLSSLLARIPCARVLEIGCGEGFLLARLPHGEKFAVDLSTEALKRARTRADAHLSVALVERLPFPSEYFDLVVGVGVMEHFLDLDEATREIRRVLTPGGRYVAVTHVNRPLGERIGQKVSEYLFPKPRPVPLARWLTARLKPAPKAERVKQPIQNRYTRRAGQACLERNGLTVVEVIHQRRSPQCPLDPWAVVYIATKAAAR